MIKNLNVSECLKILGRNHIGRLGYVFGQWPYIIPITYHHDSEEKCIISYSAEGHKMHAMRAYGHIALQVDEIKSVQNWKSVLVQGDFEEVKGSSAKFYLSRFAKGVNDVISKKGEETPKFIKDFSSKLTDRGVPLVYRISISSIEGKYR